MDPGAPTSTEKGHNLSLIYAMCDPIQPFLDTVENYTTYSCPTRPLILHNGTKSQQIIIRIGPRKPR